MLRISEQRVHNWTDVEHLFLVQNISGLLDQVEVPGPASFAVSPASGRISLLNLGKQWTFVRS